MGLSTVTSAITITADNTPQIMTTVTVSAIHPLNISLSWTNVSADADCGRDPVVFYSVECDFGTGTYTVLNSPSEGFYLAYTHISTTILNPNKNFNYRVRPLNGVGWGPYSTVVVATTCNYPTFMSQPTLIGVWYNKISLNWTSETLVAYTGNDPIIYYEVMYKPNSTASYTALTTSSQGLFYNYDHIMSSGSFPSGVTFNYTICAQNGVGMGACSADFTVTTDSVPLQMVQPTLFGVWVLQISLNWTDIIAPSYTGGSPTTYYELRYKTSSNGTYTALTNSTQGKFLYYDHIMTTPFPSNQDVYYTICAQNMIGMGACSADFAVLTDSVPLSMVQPTLFGVWYNQISLNWTDEILAT